MREPIVPGRQCESGRFDKGCDETETETPTEELALTLCEQLASSLDTEVQVAAALSNALAICAALKKRRGIVKKNMARAANAGKPRTKYGTNVPSAANMFAKAPENRALATQWWEAGGRTHAHWGFAAFVVYRSPGAGSVCSYGWMVAASWDLLIRGGTVGLDGNVPPTAHQTRAQMSHSGEQNS